MHQVHRHAIVRHNAKQMYDLVNLVEEYPQFLNWCHDSHVIEKNEKYMVAGMTVSLVGIKQKFTTKNEFFQNENGFNIELSLVKGPFEKLSGNWVFTRLTSDASKIELHLKFNFKSGILNGAFKRAFGTIAQQLVTDFVRRAKHVYN